MTEGNFGSCSPLANAKSTRRVGTVPPVDFAWDKRRKEMNWPNSCHPIWTLLTSPVLRFTYILRKLPFGHVALFLHHQLYILVVYLLRYSMSLAWKLIHNII